jgi:hypothetical protein
MRIEVDFLTHTDGGFYTPYQDIFEHDFIEHEELVEISFEETSRTSHSAFDTSPAVEHNLYLMGCITDIFLRTRSATSNSKVVI